ncbi:MAG: endonuclease MutS2 [bacterium]
MSAAAEKTRLKLEWNKIVEQLAAQAATSLGAELARQLIPSANAREVEAGQAETAEAHELFLRGINPPLGGISNIVPAVERCGRGGIVGTTELFAILQTLEGGRRLRTFLQTKLEDFPLFTAMGEDLPLFLDLEQELRRSVLNSEELTDEASPTLFRLRRELKRLTSEIRSRMEEMVRSSTVQKYLQEPIVTLRGDRYVLPVKHEFRNQIPGVIHDQSASGATVFVEPMAVFQMGNRLREVETAERHEVERILTQLSGAVGELSEGILNLVGKLAHIDFVLAKGKLALAQEAVRPQLNEKGYLDIRGGKHPLLGPDAVPISVRLGKSFDTLVITGPNTGGKTVTLKTVGLFALMHQAGLHIPAQEGSELPVYDRIFCDVGDEQSIEQSLSTFSSHMSNIIDILKECSSRSLVLLDELGAGTDPAEGAALAMSILQYLGEVGASTIATTHYSELKAFAYSQRRVENASVEFDSVTLRPTYRLLIGLPGRSSAFEIAARLGLPEPLVKRARSLLSHAEVKADDLIRSLEEKRLHLESLTREAEAERREAEQLRRDWERRRDALAKREADLIRRAKDEAVSTLNYARREAARIIKELRASSSNLIEKDRMLAANKARERLNEVQEEVRAKLGRNDEEELLPPETVRQPLKEGQTVYIPHLRLSGVVLSPPDQEGTVRVQVGVLKLELKDNQVRVGKEEEKVRERSLGNIASSKASTVSPELDLRGSTVEEAEYQVEKFLDDAYLGGLERVRIIHGKGTGALRQAIQSLLARHPQVESYALGGYREGGSGVTIAVLRK